MLARTLRMAAVPSVTLNNGMQMPIIGLGTWKSKAGEVENAVKSAIDAGYRHIDCAYVYGNEAEVGEGIAAKISDGTVKREDLFIVSKLWNTHHSPEHVKTAVERSLKNLRLDYLDLYLMHWPQAFKPGLDVLFPKDEAGNMIYSDISPLETYREMEKLVDAGLVKALGLSNFNSKQTKEIVDNAKYKPVVNQVEIHPYLWQEKLREFCSNLKVYLTAYSPLASPDRPWARDNEPKLLDDPALKEIGDKYNKSPAQVIIRWMTQRDIIVIPKSVTPSRIKANIDVMDFELDASDIEKVNSMNRDWRAIIPMVERDGKRVPRDLDAPNFPFKEDF